MVKFSAKSDKVGESYWNLKKRLKHTFFTLYVWKNNKHFENLANEATFGDKSRLDLKVLTKPQFFPLALCTCDLLMDPGGPKKNVWNTHFKFLYECAFQTLNNLNWNERFWCLFWKVKPQDKNTQKSLGEAGDFWWLNRPIKILTLF